MNGSRSGAVTLRQKFFGLVELDDAGTVLYSRVERDGVGSSSSSNGRGDLPAADLRGRNFYREVAPFENVEEFHRCLDSFRLSSQQANSITFTCQYEDGPVRVKILLARVRERSSRDDGEVTKSVLVHIRKVQS
jgi:hypothetical protein